MIELHDIEALNRSYIGRHWNLLDGKGILKQCITLTIYLLIELASQTPH